MYKRILVPVDGSDTSNLALEEALRLARESGGVLRIVHVVEELAYLAGYDQFGGYSGGLLKAMRDSGNRVLEQAQETMRQAGVSGDAMLFDQFGERLGESIAKAARAWPADLVVVGTHGRRGMSKMLLGSGAEQVIRETPVPVLVVRPPEAAQGS